MKRRELFQWGALAGGALLLGSSGRAQTPTNRRWEASYAGTLGQKPQEPGLPGKHYTPVKTPNNRSLPFRIVDGVKVFHLVAEEVWHEFAPGLKAQCWGYNGDTPGPTIEAVEGDHIRIYVTNRLPAPTSVHWHGVFLPNGMDGVSGLTQPHILPGETFVYEWVVRQTGTYLYHSHHNTMVQEGMGLVGLMVFHPRRPAPEEQVQRDYALLLNEWRIDPGTYRPNPNEMTDFNILTINGKAFPATEPLLAEVGDRVRVRIGNLSAMSHHPIHLHGHAFKIVETDGGKLPSSAQWWETTVLVPVGSTRTIEFVATEPGDWAMHCHMTHHIMNQMGHDFPNMVGINPRGLDRQIGRLVPGYMTMGQDGGEGMAEHIAMGHMPIPENSIPMLSAEGPFSYMTMGGMATVVKVRERLEGDRDPGWYRHPEGTVARLATDEEIARDLE
ncbi:MAG: exported copper oxidase [Candidatus Poribacteria bacterium]|nr:MAG: exported copper oxidase [Candidatus Poribacteria bacterium]